MLLPRPVKETLRQVLLSLRHQWYPKPNIVHLMLMSGTIHLRRRIKLKQVSARGTQFPCQRIPLGRVAPMSHQLTGRAGTVTSLVTGLVLVSILPSRMLRETSIRGVFTTLLGRVHYTTVEEIPAGEVVTISKFLINDHPVVVLFDSGASHSFEFYFFISAYDQCDYNCQGWLLY